MSHKASKQKGAGRGSSSGNVPVILDVGEKIDKRLDQTIGEKLRAAGLRTEVGGSQTSIGASKGGNVKPGAFGGYKPGMFGGYRPWYSRFGRPGMGQDAAAITERRFTLIPAALQQIKTTEVLEGIGLGILGNRAMVRLTPALWQNDSKLLHEGLAFVAGLIPMLFKRNAVTVGVAVPGAVVLGGTLVDKVFDLVGLPKARELKGGEGAPRADAALQARQKLAAIQQRINLAQSQAQRPAVPRVVAQPQYA